MNETTIKVHDKVFKKSIPFEEIDSRIQAMADRLNKDLKGKNPLFLCVLNGAFMFSSELFKKIEFSWLIRVIIII